MFKKKSRFLSILVPLGLFFFSISSSLFTPLFTQTASAADTFSVLAADYGITTSGDKVTPVAGDYILTWVNAAQVQISFTKKPDLKYVFVPDNEGSNGSSPLIDQRNSGDAADYHIDGWGCSDGAHLHMGEHGPDTPLDKAQVEIAFKPSSGSPCTNTKVDNVPMGSPELSIAYFAWNDSSNIVGVAEFNRNDNSDIGTSYTKAGADDPNIFIQDNQVSQKCPNKIVVSADASGALSRMKYYYLADDNDKNNRNGFDKEPPPEVKAPGCKYWASPTIDGNHTAPTSNFDYLIANTAQNSTKEPGTGTGGGVAGLGTGTGDENVNCDTSGNPMSWIICPIINGSLDGAQAIFTSFVEPFLIQTPISTDTSSNNPVMTIWKAFRTIGNIVLIFALLFVVFGQSIGGGIVDAYTAKKTIPRILVAAILINLSIYICAIIVDIFNVLGGGIVRIIISPLSDVGALKIRPKAGDSGQYFLGITSALAIAAGIFVLVKARDGGQKGHGGLGSIIAYILLFVVVPIFLAVLAIFLTLLIRRAIILMLVIISPVAMAMYAVPGAEKYAKKWLDAFIKTMMVYPIITGIFGVSQVLAVVTYSAGGGATGGSIVTLLATIIIAFAPLFMIPFAFKLAGGVIGGLANTIKGGRDSLKKMWGDDKHNPYSLRTKMGQSVRHNVGSRVTMGVATSGNTWLQKASRRSDTLRTAASNKAGLAAQDTAQGLLDKDPVHNVEAVKGAATRAATQAAASGANYEQTQWAAAAAADAAIQLLKKDPTASDDKIKAASNAAAAGAILASRSGDGKLHGKDAVLAAGNAAFDAQQAKDGSGNPKYTIPEINAIGQSAAIAHTDHVSSGLTGPVPAEQLEIAKNAALDAIAVSKKDGHSQMKATATANAAAKAAVEARRDSGDDAFSRTVGKAAAIGAGRAHDVGVKPGSGHDVATRRRAEEVGVDAAVAALYAGHSSPEILESAADAAAEVIYTKRDTGTPHLDKRAGKAAADARARVNDADAAAAAGRAAT